MSEIVRTLKRCLKKIKKLPFIGPFAMSLYRKWIPSKPFPGSMEYWKLQYQSGRNSGPGSYNQFAEFKAEILNRFIENNDIQTLIEYGCGDGNQLKLAEYSSYIGFDVSSEAISRCNSIFPNDKRKTFKLVDDYSGEKAQLTLSLDVIYHLIEDDVFMEYMERLFNSSERFVIIYSSNTDENQDNQAAHVKHRRFSAWVKKNQPQWKLLHHITKF